MPYIDRPEYAQEALGQIFNIVNLDKGASVCDVGAGVGHLTIPLAKKGFTIDAVEPNDAMRENGIKRTKEFKNVSWHEGTGENTGLSSGKYYLVSFGSSFNVCDRKKALEETYRLLSEKKYFTCMWNHRWLEDPIQKR